MGNEMGNNNTTGFKEEENLTVEDPKEFLSKENANQENQNVVPDLEAKDFHDQVEDISVDKQIPKEEVIEKEESGDFPLDDYPKVEAGLKEACLSNNEAEDESLIELNMDETLMSSVKKENLSLDPISTSSSDDQVPEKPFVTENDQTIGSPGGTGQVSRSISSRSSTATEVPEDLELKVNTETNDIIEMKIEESIVEPEKKGEEEKESDFGEQSGELSSPKVSSIRDLSSESEPKAVTENSHVEAYETEEKFMLLLAQETVKDSALCQEQKDLVSPCIDSDQTLTSQQDLAKIIVSIMNEVMTQPETKASSVERVSTDSDRDSVQYAQMRKSPSFSIDLQDEESDQTPLLFEDKAEIQIESLTLVNNGHSDQDQPMTMAFERSDSDKSKTPLLEKEEESQIVVTPTNQGIMNNNNNNNVDSSSSSIKVTVSSSSKGNKEKRKFRPSLFVNCMCCAAVTN